MASVQVASVPQLSATLLTPATPRLTVTVSVSVTACAASTWLSVPLESVTLVYTVSTLVRTVPLVVFAAGVYVTVMVYVAPAGRSPASRSACWRLALLLVSLLLLLTTV